MSTAIENEAVNATAAQAEQALNVCGKGIWAGIIMLSGIFSTGLHVAMIRGMLPQEFTTLLANGLPDSSLLYAGVVLLAASVIMLVMPGKKTRS